MSDFNKVLAFQGIMPYLSKEEQERLSVTLGLSLEEIEKRLVGKNREDEFILILLFMEVCKSITGFDEGVSQLLLTATSDVLVELKSGEKFMLEIKHTDTEKYSISSGNLKKRIDYAHKYGLKLYFAISIMGYWLMFDEDYMLSKNGKIDITDFKQSKLDSILGCVSYIFPKLLRIKSVYSTTAKKTTGIQFDPYGSMVSYELYYGNKRIFRVKGSNSPYVAYAMILTALQDRLSMDSQTIEKSGEFTIINEQFTNDFNAISEYKFLLSPIEHTINNNNQKYSPHTYIEQAKENKDRLNKRFRLSHIRGMMQYLVNNGVDITYIKDSYIYKLDSK